MGKYKPSAHRRGAGATSRRRRLADSSPGHAAAWIYGLHATAAVLANPRRQIRRLVATPDGVERLRRESPGVTPEIVDRQTLERILPPGAVHQGVAVEAERLEPPGLAEILSGAADAAIVVVLDQVTDPHNVGAVLRSAAAFGARAVLQTEHSAPGATGALAKAASGALEHVPLLSVTNLARAIDTLKSAGFWCVGLDGSAEHALAEVAPSGRTALVLGAEGKGLRRLTREHCDLLARLPTRPPIATLNVSNAAAVALYELARPRPSRPPGGAVR